MASFLRPFLNALLKDRTMSIDRIASTMLGTVLSVVVCALPCCSPSVSPSSVSTSDSDSPATKRPESPLVAFDRVDLAPTDDDDDDLDTRGSAIGESMNRDVRIVGRLVDAAGDPYESALVEVRVPKRERGFPIPDVLASTRTDPAGRFELPEVGRGGELELAIDGCRGGLRQELALHMSSSRTHDLGDVLVGVDRTLRGSIVVVDEAGAVVPVERIRSATITLAASRDPGEPASTTRRSSDAQRFAFREIDYPVGDLGARIWLDDGTRASFRANLDLPPGDSTFELRLPLDSLAVVDDHGTEVGSIVATRLDVDPPREDDIVVTGRVVDAEGSPIEGASVHLAGLRRTPAGLSSRTNADGTFEIECRPSDVQTLIVRALGKTVRRFDRASGRGSNTVGRRGFELDEIADLGEPIEIVVPAAPRQGLGVERDADAPAKDAERRKVATPQVAVVLERIPERATLRVHREGGVANHVWFRSHAGGSWQGELAPGSWTAALTDDDGHALGEPYLPTRLAAYER